MIESVHTRMDHTTAKLVDFATRLGYVPRR